MTLVLPASGTRHRRVAQKRGQAIKENPSPAKTDFGISGNTSCILPHFPLGFGAVCGFL